MIPRLMLSMRKAASSPRDVWSHTGQLTSGPDLRTISFIHHQGVAGGRGDDISLDTGPESSMVARETGSIY